MTREFNKEQRDDSRPSFRNKSSSDRYNREERYSSPERPRLNRETVDRAWEKGAPRLHANYRSRTNDRQAPRDNWRGRDQQRPGNFSPNNAGDSRPYGNHQDRYRDNTQRYEQDHNGQPGPSSRPYNADRRNFGNQRYDNNRGNYADRQNGARPRQNPNDGGQPRYDNNRGNYADRQNGARWRQNPNDDRQPRDPGHRGPYNNQDRTGRREYPDNTRRPEHHGNYDRNERRSYDNQRPTSPNPRAQSRPGVWNRQRDNAQGTEHAERFEGDYEHYGNHDSPRRRFRDQEVTRPSNRRPQNHDETNEQEERHVTRLPDGRVLKGPRPAQRKNAQFWTGITGETEEILNHVSTPGEEAEADVQPISEEQPEKNDGNELAAEQNAPVASAKPSRRSASAARRKKAGVSKPVSKGPKPSQRGFKWPAP